ncbi:MAG: hypothetical protein CM1200mP2_22060 [Planctomycetaceae bacterium]|nr:MAG: hypothetical protein CM1200mP2_22060 [Planctomycetaceae bacterium]
MNTPPARRIGILAILGPGMLVAATGVGAGDLATAALAGSRLGTAVLWAVIVGAVMKFVLTEGLARWQLATDQTLLEGTARHLGRECWRSSPSTWLRGVFFFGSALVSACGATAHAIWPLPGSTPDADKIVYGIIHSLVALGLVWIGGYRLFERVMGICIGVMFVTVVTTAFGPVAPTWGIAERTAGADHSPTGRRRTGVDRGLDRWSRWDGDNFVLRILDPRGRANRRRRHENLPH